MVDYSELKDVSINDPIPENQFNDICNCIHRRPSPQQTLQMQQVEHKYLETCIYGLCCPCCLFGRTYERSQFGSFFNGCCKYFSIQMMFTIVISSINFDYQWNNIYAPLYDTSQNIRTCHTAPNCSPYFNGNKLIDDLNQTNLADNNCYVPEYLHVCKCLNDFLPDKCRTIENLPENIRETIMTSMVINTAGGLFNITILGFFLEHYRQKLADKLNIRTSRIKGFLYHCLPFINPCALCQEANTLDRLNIINNTIMPITTVNKV